MLLSGIAFLVIGILFLVAPNTSSLLIARVAGIVLLLEGLARAFAAWRRKEKGISTKAITAVSVIMIVLGIILLVRPVVMIGYSYFIFGGVMILNALSNIIGFLKKEIQVEGNQTLFLMFSIALAVAGIVVLFNPFASNKMMMQVIGIMLIVDGVINLFTSLKMKN